MSVKIKTLSEQNPYPELIWMSAWTFGFDPLSDQTNVDHNTDFFQTLDEKGSVSGTDPDAWKIHFMLPLKSHINYFSNGFIVKRSKTLAVIACPAPNVLCGFIHKRFGIELQCEHSHNQEQGTTHFRTKFGSGTLLRKENEGIIYFSMAIDMDSHEEADKMAYKHFTHTPNELISLHGPRQKLINTFDSFQKLNTLPAIAGECLIKQLRKPEGILNDIWPASPALDNAVFSLNELYPLLTAWADIDPTLARKIYDMAITLQRQDGHFPSWVSPTGDRNSFDAPHLFFAQCAELLFKKNNDQAHVKKVLPKLNNYMRWSLRHYLPQNALHPSGQSAQETLTPKLWQKEFASAEHNTLLVCELEALIRLHESMGNSAPLFITQARETLSSLIEKEFWDPQTRTFSRCYLKEEKVTRHGLHEYLPLLYTNLNREIRATLLAQLKLAPWAHGFQTDPLTGGKSEPATPLQQFIILQCIKHPANPEIQTAAYVSKIWNNLSLWQNQYFHHKSSTSMPIIDTAFICLVIDLHTLRVKFFKKSASWLKKVRTLIHKLHITKDDLMIALIFGALIIGTHMLYQNRTSGTANVSIQEARINYQNRNAKETARICSALLKKQPHNQEARLLLANLLLASDVPTEAEMHYRKLRELDKDNPAFIVGLGMSLHRQGNSIEANECYQEFLDYFSPYFPDTSALVNRMQNIDTKKLTNYFISRMISSKFMLTL